MIRQAYVQFPKYGNQIKCQVPPCINDASMPDEEKLDKDIKWQRIVKMVDFFNAVFTSREGSVDKHQISDRKSGSTSQLLEDEEDEEKATRVKRAKHKGNSAHDS